MERIQKTGKTDIVVDAPVGAVWDVVSDVTRVTEWSHECRAAGWLGGAHAAAPGVRFRGSNKAGRLRWSRTCEVVTVDAPHELVWRTVPSLLYPDSTEWRIRLSPVGGGTRISQQFSVLRAPWLLDLLYARLIPGHRDRNARLAEDLVRLGTVAARDTASPSSAR